MGARKLRRLVTALLTAIVLLPALPASAERIASRADDKPASREAGLARVHEALADAEVAKALAAQGLSADEVEQRLAQLSAEDVERLAANLDQVQAAGNVPQYIWILLAIFLAVSILAIIF
jgi:predicted exporter